MKFHELYPYNKLFFYTGAILGTVGTYLDSTNKSNYYIVYAFLISGLVLILLSFRKPKERDQNELENNSN